MSFAFVSPVLAQRAPAVRKVQAHQTYERITAVVPFVGTGAKGDPKRPMFAPILAAARNTPGVKSFDRKKNSKDEIEGEGKKLKADFDVTKLSPRVR